MIVNKFSIFTLYRIANYFHRIKKKDSTMKIKNICCFKQDTVWTHHSVRYCPKMSSNGCRSVVARIAAWNDVDS
jgi:hypothetical protein